MGGDEMFSCGAVKRVGAGLRQVGSAVEGLGLKAQGNEWLVGSLQKYYKSKWLLACLVVAFPGCAV